MKNQYVGDIGDYGKYGMLRFLSEHGIRIGINWYLTEDDGGNDGKAVDYLKMGKGRCHDEVLFDFLASVAKRGDKSVNMVEAAGVIPNAIFYNRYVGEGGRQGWHASALEALKDAELVFCDPDTGPLGKKPITARDADKYVAPAEIKDYYDRGQNVVYYCQRARRTADAWIETKLEMTKFLPHAMLYVLTFHGKTQRAYIFVIHPEDYRSYFEILHAFEQTSWVRSGLFTGEEVKGWHR